MKPLVYTVIPKKNGCVEFTVDEFKKILEEVYAGGFVDGRNAPMVNIPTSWTTTSSAASDAEILCSGRPVEIITAENDFPKDFST